LGDYFSSHLIALVEHISWGFSKNIFLPHL